MMVIAAAVQRQSQSQRMRSRCGHIDGMKSVYRCEHEPFSLSCISSSLVVVVVVAAVFFFPSLHETNFYKTYNLAIKINSVLGFKFVKRSAEKHAFVSEKRERTAVSLF
jgi:accessory gene regulator protein AgrB